MHESDTDRVKGLRKAGILSGIPTALAGGIAVGYYAGHFADLYFVVTEPWLGCVGALFGIVAGGRVALQLIERAGRDDRR